MPRCHPAPHPFGLSRPLAPVVLCLLLSACGSDTATLAAASAMPARDALPDCGRIAAAVGDVVTGWRLMPESGPWDNPGQQGYGIDCMWASPQLQSDNAFEVVQGAALMVRINATPGMQTAAEVGSIGWTIDDPSVDAIGGYLAYPSGQLDFAAPLGPVGPEVVVGKVAVSLVRSGVMLVNDVDEGEQMTYRRAVDAAVAVHRLIER